MGEVRGERQGDAQKHAQGLLALVVGPSGAGKDTLMRAAAARRPELRIARRVITRPADAGGEDHEAVDEATFADRAAAGAFALHWSAHGLRYGVPAAIEQDLAAGRTVLVNVSRSVIEAARPRFAPLSVLYVTARRDVLAARLAARGRESAEDVANRLARTVDASLGPDVAVIDNSGSVEDGADAVLAALSRATSDA